MGIDAPSTDLTARIRAKRAALVLAGEVAPARPGEHTKHGMNPGAILQLEKVAAAAEARERRGRTPEVVPEGKVYDMDYLDGELEGTTEPDGDVENQREEPSGGDALLEAELDEDTLAVLADRELATGYLTADTDTPMRLAVIEEQCDGISKALVMIAEHVAATPEAVAAIVFKQAGEVAAQAADARPAVGMIRRFFRWLW